MKPQDIIIVLIFIGTFALFFFMNQEDKTMSMLLNTSKSAYVVMNYSSCEKTGLVVLCAAEVSRAISERNITVRPYVFSGECTDPNQNTKSIAECQKELIGFGIIVGCGERLETNFDNIYYYIGNETDLRDCRIANKIKLS